MMLRKAVADLMAEEVETAEETTNITDVTKMMAKRNIGAVIIMGTAKTPVGIFTERDLLKRVVAEGIDPLKTPISKVMTAKFVCVHSHDDVEDLAQIMIQGNFRHLPVMDGTKLVGILSLKDIVKYLAGIP